MDEQFALKVSFQELDNSSRLFMIFFMSCVSFALIVYIINTIINIYIIIQEKSHHQLRFID